MQIDLRLNCDLELQLGARSHEANRPALSLHTKSWPDVIANAAKAKKWSQALLLFEEATELRMADLAAYNAALFACKQAGLWQSGLALLCKLQTQGLQADAMTLATAAAACERGSQWQQALSLLSDARDTRRESAVMSNTVLNACANSQNWQQALLLLAETHSHRLQSFLITRNAVLAACSRRSLWQPAVKLLEDFCRESMQVDVVTYNNALSACVKSKQWQQSLQLFEDLQLQLPEDLDAMSFEFAVSACAKGEQWQTGLQLMSRMLDRSFQVHPITRSVAIGMCQRCASGDLVLRLLDGSENVQLNGKALKALAKSSQWESGVQLLDSMVRRKVADVMSYTSMMGAFEATSHWTQALQLLRDVQKDGVEVDPLLFSVAINACQNAQQWPVALDLVVQGGGQRHWHSSPYCAMLQGLGSEMLWQEVLMFLDDVGHRIEDDVAVQSAAVNACALGSWEAAHCLLQQMKVKKLPTQYATSALMKSASQALEWEIALRLFNATDAMDLVGFNTAISACQVAARWEEALRLLQQMHDRQLQADDVSYSAAISTCGKALCWEQALQLMSKTDNVKVFNSVMDACARSSQWQHALQVFMEIPRPDMISFNTLINACARGSERPAALQLFAQLAESNLAPDVYTFTSMMTGADDRDQVSSLLQELRKIGLEANVVTYNAAIRACCRAGQWPEALGLFYEMQEIEISPDDISFNSAIAACNDQWPLALSFFDKLTAPDGLSFRFSISSCALGSAWQKALQLLHDAQEQHLELDSSMGYQMAVEAYMNSMIT